MHFGNFALPVAMTRTNRGRPLERVGAPGILAGYLTALEYGIEEIENKHQLDGKDYHRHRRNEMVQVLKLVKGDPPPVVRG